jgi:hypothetical protein
MAHELLQGRQGDAGPRHIGPEGVAETMGIGAGRPTLPAMVTEQGTKAGGGKRLSAAAAFQANEQGGGRKRRSFLPEVKGEDLACFWGQGQDARLLALAQDAQPGFGQLEVVKFEGEDFAAAQAVQQHQPQDGQITEGTEAAPELSDFGGGKRHHEAARFFQLQAVGQGSPRPAITEG